MLFLAPGGMSTRRSGLRLFMPRLTGGGDFACMFLFMPPGETSRPGELRWFPYPFPAKEREKKMQRDTGYSVFVEQLMNQRCRLCVIKSCLILFFFLMNPGNPAVHDGVSLIKNYRNPFSPLAHFQGFRFITTSCGRTFMSSPVRGDLIKILKQGTDYLCVSW